MDKMDAFKQICKYHNVALAYLFGSRAEEGLSILKGQTLLNNDPLTDIDLGIVFAQDLPGTSRLPDLYAELYNELSDLFLPFPLDLVFIQENHSVFQAEAICGICVYSCDEVFRQSFEEDVLRRAADFRPFLEKYLDEYLEANLNQGDKVK